MPCGPNPSTRSEPSPQARARIRGCLFLWLLSFGQAKESNWPPWMADKPHTDVSRLSRKHRSAEPTCPHPNPLPQAGEGKRVAKGRAKAYFAAFNRAPLK